MRPSSPQEKFVLSYNDFRVLAWQLDQQPVASVSSASSTSLSVSSTASVVLSSCNELRSKPKGKRKLADRSIISFANRRERSKSPRKRVKTSSAESGSTSHSFAQLEPLAPALTPSSFAAAINLTSGTVPELKPLGSAEERKATPSVQSQSSEETSASDSSCSGMSSPGKGCCRRNRVALEFSRPNFCSGLPGFESDGETDIHESSEPPRPMVNNKYVVPEFISSLIRDFSESSVTPGCIPGELEPTIQKYSHGTEYIPKEAFGARPYKVEPKPLFCAVRSILATAHRIYKSRKDEKAWHPLVRSVLSGPFESARAAPFLEIDESQTKHICRELLPLSGNLAIPSVKTDQLLQFNRDNKHVAAVLNPLFVREPDLSLSAFDDPVSAKTFTGALVEVTAPSGDFEGCVYRFTLASAAIIARLRLLMKQTGNPPAPDSSPLMPVLGWVVHGHSWHLHLSYQQPDGSIVSIYQSVVLFPEEMSNFPRAAYRRAASCRKYGYIPRRLSSPADC